MALKLSDPNKLYFNTDDDFYRFCVVPELVICQCPAGRYTDVNFSYVYLDAVNANKIFGIRQKDSQICKHNAVSYRTITKPIKNVVEQFHYPKHLK